MEGGMSRRAGAGDARKANAASRRCDDMKRFRPIMEATV